MRHKTTKHDAPDQSETIRFLSNGAGAGRTSKRIDTLGAMVFLIGRRALKVKRQVKYDDMDLSILDQRLAMLAREYALNRPFAPSN